MVFCGRERIRTERIKDILRYKSLCKCRNLSGEVITAVYSEEEYANLATIFIIITNNYSLRNEYVMFSLAYISYTHTKPTANKRTDEHVLCPVVFDLAGLQSLDTN